MTTMPRYFFNLVNEGQTVEDLEGLELTGDAAAREEARLFALSISEGRSHDDRDWTGWSVIVVGESGLPVDTVPIMRTV